MVKLINDPLYGYLRFEKIPTTEEIANFYKEEFYSIKYKKFNDSAKENQDKQFNSGRFSDYFNVCENILGSLKGKKILDIGCGYGELLLYAKEIGMEVTGLEVSDSPADYLKEKGIPVILSDVTNDFSKTELTEKYDIVTLVNVLEHIADPYHYLLSIREHLLAPSGILLIEVPNEFNEFQLAANRKYELNNWWISYPAHINYFSYDSLANLLQAANYEVRDCYSSFPLELFLLMGDVYINKPELGALCHNKRVLFEKNLRDLGKQDLLLNFYRKMAQFGLGRQMVFFAVPDRYSVQCASKQLED